MSSIFHQVLIICYVISKPMIVLVLFSYNKVLQRHFAIIDNNGKHDQKVTYLEACLMSLVKIETKCFFFHHDSNRFCVIAHFITRYTLSTIYTRVDMYRQIDCYYLRSGIFHYFLSRLHSNVYFQAFYISESPLFYLSTIFPNGNILLRLLSSLLERSNNV